MLTLTGAIAREPDGSPRFEPALAFSTTSARRHFEHTALVALRAVAPDLFSAKK